MGLVGRGICHTQGLIFYLAPSSGRHTLMAARITRTLYGFEMSESNINYLLRKNSTRILLCSKLLAVALSFMFAFRSLPFIGEPELNLPSATFCIALVGMIPKFGWTIPSIINGLWLTPLLFALRVNGSFAKDLTAMIIGGIIGLAIGLLLDIRLDRNACARLKGFRL